ncbi:conserved hypothetical protein [Pediculus humanus corporis]|uniref:Transmembrane protein 138 n=1 Tax=Pediculus humanus subsp. corporis TaxID=121224 RepID=E0VIA7_PEDHC|nr:uncharacterized protein Phum_PHUM222170 [Pediculus humanus corporis]EEB13113.1 conserved hypothetical protein [Pediculus humanus corporis]
MSYSVRYTFLLTTQILLIIADVLLNSLSEFTRLKPELQLVAFIFQDVFIVISLTVTLIGFFSTYVFQAGLVELLFDRFRLAILISVFYFIITIILHAWLLTIRWNNPNNFNWTDGLTIFFSCQRMFSPIYYYSTKRAMLRISDPRFYQSLDWISRHILDKT